MIKPSDRTGVTIMEITIAAAVMSLFMAGLFGLYRSGSKLSSSTLWVQHTINHLKLACREINNVIKKGTYPTSITFPGNISENTSEDFALHYFAGTMYATQTAGISGGAKVLAATESAPAKIGFASKDNRDAVLTYHIVALEESRKLIYSRWQETVPGDTIKSLSRSSIPPGNATGIFTSVLARDVESVACEPTSKDNPRSPLVVKIACRIANGETSRSEQAVGNPNVDIIENPNIGGW